MAGTTRTSFHIAMFPWFAMGHFIPFIRFSNKLAAKGHRVSLLVPTKIITSKLNQLNLFPDLISLIPLQVPHVDGLPLGTETMSDVPVAQARLLCVALDLTQTQLQQILPDLNPHFIFYDFAHWVPKLARSLGIIPIFFSIGGPILTAFTVPSYEGLKQLTPEDLLRPPLGSPSSSYQLPRFLLSVASFILYEEFGLNITLFERMKTAVKESDALSFRTCKEVHGPFCDYMESQLRKPVLQTGPIITDDDQSQSSNSVAVLEERWAEWLGRFKEGSVVYCAFGSESKLRKEQFQELVLGLELTGLPFLVAMKPPFGAESVDEALPDGFQERASGRGVVYGGWVQQELILKHSSVGCFVGHGGYGSIWEALVISHCQIVVVSQILEHFTNAKLMTEELRVAVEVERREEDGWFTRESVCRAVKLVMDEGSQVGDELKRNHAKYRSILSKEGFESSYIDSYILKLESLMKA